MKKKVYDNISLKLILLIALCFISSFSVFLFINNYLANRIVPLTLLKLNEIGGKNNVNTFKLYTIPLVVIISIVFITVFLLGIRKRLKYLKSISSEISNPSSDYVKLDVKGSDELAILAENINIMSNHLKKNREKEIEVEKNKNDLIVAVSHDLKTPLTSIIGYLELLKNNSLNLNTDDREYLNISYEKSLKIKKLINQLFEYTKLTSGYIVLDKINFNIPILINQVVGEHEPFLNNKNIKVEINSNYNELWCKVDVQQIIRVFENIVKNAEKYSYENSTFKVNIDKVNSNILISFENTGDNIGNKDLDRIFEKMYRMDKSRGSKIEGSGLGLAISRQIIQLHGGELWAECNDNIIRINLRLNCI